MMTDSIIRYGTPAWFATLRVYEEPMRGEGLIGFLLRLAEINGRRDGSAVFRAVSPYGCGPNQAANRPASQYLGAAFDLQRLAQIANVHLADVERLTFRRELRQLLGPAAHPLSVGEAPPFQVCPRCVAERWLIKLEFALPWIDTCVEHGVALVSRCTCGADLRPWLPKVTVPAFVCPACGIQRFATMAARELPGPYVFLQRRLLHAYRTFFETKTSDFVRAAHLVLRHAAPSRWDWGWFSPEFPVANFPARRVDWASSLQQIAGAFVGLQIAPERVAELLPLPTDDIGECRNRSCGHFRSSRLVRLFGARRGDWETYCLDCGSRFLGDRIILSFLLGHGDHRLADASVRTSMARLARYQQSLVEACRRDRRRQLLAGQLFRDAGIPMWPNLRARSLGLVQIVQEHLDPDLVPTGILSRFRYPAMGI